MKSAMLVAVAALAAIAGTARADEADASQFSIRFESSRPRAEVLAEAAKVTVNFNNEPEGARVAPMPRSSVEAKTVRAQAAEALRLGRIPRGEVGPS